jgi:fumarate reductase subunit C
MLDGLSEGSRSGRRDTALQTNRSNGFGEEVAVPEERAMTTPVRAYRQPVDRYWWAKRRSYLLFMLREISCVFVAWFVVYLLLLVHAISTGPDSYVRFLDWSANPLVISLNVVALIFLLLHTVTWFNLAPRAIVPHVRGHRVPARAVLAGHYAAWFVISAVVAWVVMS